MEATCFYTLTFADSVALWLKFWSDAISRGEQRTGLYLGTYAVLQIAGVCWFALLIWYEGSLLLTLAAC